MTKVNLGDKVKDSISGFAGIAVARTQWLTGCDRITVQPDKLDKDGKTYDAQTFDEPQLIVVTKAKIKVDVEKRTPKERGGPRPNIMQKASPVK